LRQLLLTSHVINQIHDGVINNSIAISGSKSYHKQVALRSKKKKKLSNSEIDLWLFP
jgi:predicted alpha/beta superfamily hydrolase